MTPVEFVAALILVAVSLSAGMSLAWFAWRKTKNAGWVDVIWTVTLGLTGIVGSFAVPGAFWRHAMIAFLLVVWVLRLGSHIAGRNRRRRDDPRYAKLLEGWGTNPSRQMFWLMQKQALVSTPLALALLLAAGIPQPAIRIFDILGFLVVIVAIGGEALLQ